MAILKNTDEIKNLNLTAWDLVSAEELKDLNSVGLLLKHKKSGARVVIVSGEDKNKVFSIGFKTPPTNDTGLQHILEHSTLCGSRKYPVKDPFVELVKGSLNTFLNAMTYPDKTVYPVASCNDTDFKNIVDVYMDAVFYPNIYKHKEIFKQEGWHYELEDKDAPLTVNGVVFNEMKGVYSSADDVLARYISSALFKDTCYAYESGGDPKAIPSLTYEEFLDYHRTYYHPSNSYIYLYGDFDVQERLDYLDSEYLKDFDKETCPVHPVIERQNAFDVPVDVTEKYAVTESEPIENNSILSETFAIGDALDAKLSLAMQALDYTLILSSGAVLKQAIVDAGIGVDVDSSYETSCLQPYYSIVVKNADPARKQEFLTLIDETLERLAEEGLNKDTLEAAINSMEFKYREADFGHFPKGLMYYLSMMDSWLYDENQPFIYAKLGGLYEELRAEINTGYFEELIKKYFLNNTHRAIVTMNPSYTLSSEIDAEEKERMAKIKASFSDEELESIMAEEKALKEYQSEASSQEELLKVPMLKLSDISKEPPYLPVIEEDKIGDARFVKSDIFTNGIAYMTLSFDMNRIPQEILPYAGIYASVIGLMDTEHYSYAEFSAETDKNVGSMTTDPTIYRNVNAPFAPIAKFEVRGKALYGKVDKFFELAEEMLFHTDFSDEKRLKELLAKLVSRMESSMTGSGHVMASRLAKSQFSEPAYYTDLLHGYRFYKLVKKISGDFENEKQNLFAAFKTIQEVLFTQGNVLYHAGAETEGLETFSRAAAEFQNRMPAGTAPVQNWVFTPVHKRVAYTTSSQVNYVSRAGNFVKHGMEYNAALRVLKIIFSYEYLWINIRVKGGAYGCMSNFERNGDGALVSYRDPHIESTNKIYDGAGEYVKNFEVSDRDMLKFIIGTVGTLDTPLPASGLSALSYTVVITESSEDVIRKNREQVLNCNQESIRALAPLVQSCLDDDYMVVIGNEEQIKSHADMFDEILPFIG